MAEIFDVYPNEMKRKLEDKIKEFSEITGLPEEVQPIFGINNIFLPIYNQFNEGKTEEEKINAKRQLGSLMVDDPEWYFEPTGNQELVDRKNAITNVYEKQTLPLIHEKHGEKIKEASFKSLKEKIEAIYSEVNKIEDQEKKKGALKEVEFIIGDLIFKYYNKVLDNGAIKSLNKLYEALAKNDRATIEKAVKETAADMENENYVNLLVKEVLSSENRTKKFVDIYTRIKVRELAKEYVKDGRVDYEKLDKELKESLGKDNKKYGTLVNQIYAEAAANREAEHSTVEDGTGD